MSFISRLLDQLRGSDMPELRHAARSASPTLMVEIGGYAHKARDWSAGGACIEGFAEAVVIGNILSGHLYWANDRRRLSFAAEVMRLDPGGALALRWLDLPLAIQQEMEAHIG
ncbi:MAG: PilZ domain-containing protein [Parvibaculaceae bacterium]|nr:PilZ domain-containing protein [Parvibaculaceae bacterium]